MDGILGAEAIEEASQRKAFLVLYLQVQKESSSMDSDEVLVGVADREE